MPYTTEKSMVFQVTESWANGDRGVALDALWHLMAGHPVTDLKPIESRNLNSTPNQPFGYPDAAARRKHVEEDWWGWRPPLPATRDQGDPSDPKQRPFNPITNPTTGFWKHWYGNAEAVFRETMIRALTVSLGLPRDATPSTHGGRSGQHWPISIIWKCPCPWYEGWIEFKSYGKKWYQTVSQGHVTVILSTPAHGVKLYDSPVQPGAVVNPRQPAGPEGLWVVSQSVHLMVDNPTRPPEPQPALPDSTPSPAGTWGPPTLGQPVRSVGSVVCVAPSIGDGGADPAGMPYLAPTP